MADTCSGEDSWSEDGDTSNTNPFLHDLEPDDKLDTASSVEFPSANAEEHSEVGVAVGSLAFEFCNVADVLEFSFGLALVLAIFTTETTKDVASFTLTANLDQPARRFREVPADSKEQQKWGDLEADGESPGEGCGAALVEVAAIFDPVSDDNTEDVQCEFDGNELTARSMLRSFGGPDRNDSVKNTSAPSIDQASFYMSAISCIGDHKLTEDHPGSVHSGGLKASANDAPDGAQSDGLDTSVLVSEPATGQAAHEGANVIDGHDAALFQAIVDFRVSVFSRMPEFHGLVIVIRRGVDTAHHTLIITEKKDG